MKKEKKAYNQADSSNNGEREDRISKLPDSLLHLIFSFLDMSYVVQTSFLSRRWRYLWTSLPFLNFDVKLYIHQFYNNKSRKSMRVRQIVEDDSGNNFLFFVDRVLFFRNQNFNIERFRVGGGEIVRDCKLVGQLYSWIHVAVRHNVEELDLQLSSIKDLSRFLAKCVLNCKSLTMLKLDFIGSEKPYFDLPDDDSMKIILPALKTLHLSSVLFLTEDIANNFFSRACPVLETLVISNCRIDELTISALQLKNLVIIDMNPRVYSYGYNYPKLSVFAPKLITFCIKGGNWFRDCSLMSNSSLVKADITTSLPGSYHNVGTMMKRVGPPVDREDKVKHTESVIKCLREISNVRSLTLSTWLLEDVYEIHNAGFRSLLSPFCNLSVLKLRTTLSMSHYRVIAYLLEECPNVEDVVLELPKNSSNFLKKEEADLPSHCNLHHLKFVQIQNSVGRSNELAFLKFLLKNAMILQKVTVYKYKEVCNREWFGERFKTFGEELVNFVAASNSCTKIYFF